jgi:glycosyltransferase involved in cell wall biosynthesis
MKISLIIPAYNEARRIGDTLNDYYNAFRDELVDFEIIVEMDGCTDNTGEIVKEYGKGFANIRTIESEQRLGKGGGIKKGFLTAKGEIIGFTDADNSTQTKEFIKLIRALELNGADIVVGNRYSGVNSIPLVRKVFSRGFNLLVKLLFGLHMRDTQCGAKAFRRGAVKELLSHLVIDDFTFDVNFLYAAKKQGFTIKEVDIEWEYREGSKVNLLRVTPKMFFSLLRLRIFYSPVKCLAMINREKN